MKKILVIHPDDRSTDFLKPIYENIEATVITKGKTKDEVRHLIEIHDKIIMLGHGSPGGLFSMGNFNCGGGYIIDNTMVAALGNKHNVYIWCNANKFIEYYYLKGFYTGMFISEYSEANYCKVKAESQHYEIEKSNQLFAKVVGNSILMESKNLHANTKLLYYMKNSEVNKYNNNRLFYRN